MSNAVFPTLIGLGWPVKKTPTWNTIQQRAASGQEVRVALQSYPLYAFELIFNVLKSADSNTDFQALIDFYNARQGAYDDFLFDDKSDDSIPASSPSQFGTGDGTTTSWQLTRAISSMGFIEPVMNLNGAPVIYVNGSVQASGYTISSSGVITFTAAPSNGATLSWSGSYYFRCRFVNDTEDFDEFLSNYWRAQKVQLIGSLGNKV